MGTREFVGNTLADGMMPLFKRPVEDVVYETLDRRDVPSRAEMREYVDSRADSHLVARIRDLEETVKALQTRLDALSANGKPTPAVDKASTASAAAPKTGKKPGCLVADCEDPVRSKGFCARHYQKMRRGTLKGFENHA